MGGDGEAEMYFDFVFYAGAGGGEAEGLKEAGKR